MTAPLEQIEIWRTLLSDFVATFAPNEAIAAYHDCRLEALFDLAKRGLATMPRPIGEAVIGEQYMFFSCDRFRCIEHWSAPWEEGHHKWTEPFTHCILLSALDFKP